ncbi:phosphatidylglycerophosphatase A [Candidatus Gillettellia adelgis]
MLASLREALKDSAKRRIRICNPWHLLATGFGIGLFPVMPGTMGSLAAIPCWLLLIQLSWPLYSLLITCSICIGIYVCYQTTRDIQVHDHSSIVWDEFVGMWITLTALPVNNLQWVIVGLIIFRVLDIWKPIPIRWLDHNVRGGIGIMIDDIFAGILSAGIIYLINYSWLM